MKIERIIKSKQPKVHKKLKAVQIKYSPVGEALGKLASSIMRATATIMKEYGEMLQKTSQRIQESLEG